MLCFLVEVYTYYTTTGLILNTSIVLLENTLQETHLLHCNWSYLNTSIVLLENIVLE